MSNDQASAPTMHEIAERAGVGKATVSLALRDDPRLRPETRRRIQKLAAKMGYRTNATVAALMAQLRASRTPKYQATLGFLNVSPDPKPLTGLPTFHAWVKGCHDRAAKLGYGLDAFWLHEPGISPARLARILETRGIRGLVIAPLLDRPSLPQEIDLICQRFACVVVGMRPTWPPLNFASNDQFTTSLHAVQHLWQYGSRRIGLVINPEADLIAGRRFSAGFWAAHQDLADCGHIPPFPFHESRKPAFRAWYQQHQPDAILTLHDEVKTWIEEMHVKIPSTLALAHLDRHDDLLDWAGMRQNTHLIGAAAIDMLIGQLHRNEAGLPDYPKASIIQSTWLDGPTVTGHPPRKPTLPPIKHPISETAAV